MRHLLKVKRHIRSAILVIKRSLNSENMGSVFGKIGEEMPRYNSLGIFAPTDSLGFEIRHYEPAVAVQTEMPGQTESNAFNLLARYIGVIGTAQNDRKEGISMTAPVVNSMNLDNEKPMTDMQFVLPQSLYGGDVSKAPPPSADGVQLVERPEKTMGVHTFSGTYRDHDFTAKVKQLVQTIEKMAEADADFGWKVKQPLVSESYRYNPPWTLPFMKTNEVAVELEAVKPKEPVAED